MKVTKCKANHFYDAEKFSACPHCGQDAQVSNSPKLFSKSQRSKRIVTEKSEEINQDNSNFHPVSGNGMMPVDQMEHDPDNLTASFISGFVKEEGSEKQAVQEETVQQPVMDDRNGFTPDDSNVTVPLDEPFVPEMQDDNMMPEREAAPPAPPVMPEKETLQQAVKKAASPDPFEQTRTMAIYSDTAVDPVVGWLISLDGEYKGTCFNLKGGRNHIGRSMCMDIALVKEISVSRDKHAILTYEPKKREFYLQPGDGSGLVYVNDDILMMPALLADHSIVQLGNCKFLFKALCGDQFTWDDYL